MIFKNSEPNIDLLNRSSRYIETRVVLDPLGLFPLIRTGPALRTGPPKLALLAQNLEFSLLAPPSTDGEPKEAPES